MTINLTKGERISLTKMAEKSGDSELKIVRLGLGWKTNAFSGADFDLDSSVFLAGKNGHIRRVEDFVFYKSACKNENGYPCDADGCVVHSPDNTTGDDSGDDAEWALVDLAKVPADVCKISCAITIYNAKHRKQNFGMISDAYVRVINEETGVEQARYDLSNEFSTDTAMIVCELNRVNGSWTFAAVGQGWPGGLASLCGHFGLDVEEESGN